MWNPVPTRTRWREPRDGGYRVTAMEGPSEPARARLVSLRPVARPRLYEQLVERLLALVHELHLAPGDRFPPERELAAALDVSRATLRQALVALEVQGVVEVRHGNGAILRANPPHDTVLDAFRAHARRLPDVIDARMALEVHIAQAIRAGDPRAAARTMRAHIDLVAKVALLEDATRDEPTPRGTPRRR